jgi:hypothetical protein
MIITIIWRCSAIRDSVFHCAVRSVGWTRDCVVCVGVSLRWVGVSLRCMGWCVSVCGGVGDLCRNGFSKDETLSLFLFYLFYL